MMTLDHIDETAEARLGDNFMVPIIKALTAYCRQLEARVEALEDADRHGEELGDLVIGAADSPYELREETTFETEYRGSGDPTPPASPRT